jgi:hypothetical protein
VLAALSAAAAARPAAAAVEFAADRRSVMIGAGAGEVVLVRFIRRRETDVAGGENAGRTLRDANAVRELRVLGKWNESARRFAIGEPPGSGEGVAVLVQAPDGAMLGAAALAGEE